MSDAQEKEQRTRKSTRYNGLIREVVNKKTGKISYECEFWLYNDHYHRVCKGCNTFEEAEMFVTNLQKKIHDLHNGFIDASQTITLKEMFDSLEKTGMVDNCVEYAELQKSHIRRFLAFWGDDKIIADLTPAMIEEYRVMRLKEVVPNTVNHDISTLRKAFNHIIVNRRLTLSNPCKLIKKFKVAEDTPNPVTLEEWNALRKELAPHILNICLFLVQTGLRPRQVYNLSWDRINLDTKTPYIQILSTDRGNKSKKDYIVVISKCLKKVIEKMGVKESGYLFLNPQTRKPYKDIRTGFFAACKRAGIKRHIVPYNLKDSVGTTLARAGEAGVTIQQVFNQSSVQIAEKYIKLIPQDKIKAMEKLKNFK